MLAEKLEKKRLKLAFSKAELEETTRRSEKILQEN